MYWFKNVITIVRKKEDKKWSYKCVGLGRGWQQRCSLHHCFLHAAKCLYTFKNLDSKINRSLDYW